ncbi:MAG: hypothetical protein ACI8S6_004006 [Myxococcota bacterium]|jgi:hypothetical protein
MEAPDLHADRRELRYLRQHGAEVTPTLGALSIRLPRPGVLAWPGMLLMMGLGCTVPLVVLSQALPALSPIVAVVGMVMLGLVSLYGLAFILLIILEALTPLQRRLYTELVLSSQALRVGQTSLALESLGHLSVSRRLGRWRLHAETTEGARLLVEMSSQTPLERLAVLLQRHVSHRRSVLAGEGHDLTEDVEPPAALMSLVSAPRRR